MPCDQQRAQARPPRGPMDSVLGSRLAAKSVHMARPRPCGRAGRAAAGGGTTAHTRAQGHEAGRGAVPPVGTGPRLRGIRQGRERPRVRGLRHTGTALAKMRCASMAGRGSGYAKFRGASSARGSQPCRFNMRPRLAGGALLCNGHNRSMCRLLGLTCKQTHVIATRTYYFGFTFLAMAFVIHTMTAAILILPSPLEIETASRIQTVHSTKGARVVHKRMKQNYSSNNTVHS